MSQGTMTVSQFRHYDWSQSQLTSAFLQRPKFQGLWFGLLGIADVKHLPK